MNRLPSPRFLSYLACLLTMSATAQIDMNSPEMKAGQAKYEAMRQAAKLEAGQMTTDAVFKELKRIDELRQARIALHPESWLLTTDEDQRGIAFAVELADRRNRGDVAASFFYGVRQWEYCSMWQRDDARSPKASDCWADVMRAFKMASDAELADATFNVARMYEHAYGVIGSKYVAADWYVKSAEQYNKKKSRDEALTALESALTLVPDHPAALRLRKVMLK